MDIAMEIDGRFECCSLRKITKMVKIAFKMQQGGTMYEDGSRFHFPLRYNKNGLPDATAAAISFSDTHKFGLTDTSMLSHYKCWSLRLVIKTAKIAFNFWHPPTPHNIGSVNIAMLFSGPFQMEIMTKIFEINTKFEDKLCKEPLGESFTN